VIDPLRLRLLLEVDRLGSITRAAEACSVGQPTASAHLHRLEAAIGHPLFERAGRGTRLTDAGRLLARHAAVVLSTLEGLEEELAALGAARSGTLRLAACDGFGNYVLPAVLAVFAPQRAETDIRVRIASSGEVLRTIAQGDAQLGIAGRTRRPPGVLAEPVLRDELVWIAPRGLPPVDRVLTPAALQDHTLIVPGPDSSTRAHTDRLLARLACRPARVIELHSIEAVKRAVRAGLGVAMVSRLTVSDEFASGDLRQIELLGAELEQRSIEIVRPEHRTPTPLEQVFEQTLRDHCRRLERNPPHPAGSDRS
jgi:molybdate transport repressor ModE-like protein